MIIESFSATGGWGCCLFSSMQDGLTAIDHAAFLGHKKMITFLLEQNASTSKKSPVSHQIISYSKLCYLGAFGHHLKSIKSTCRKERTKNWPELM